MRPCRAAAAAIIVLALGACSSTTTTPATSTAASAGPSGGPGTLTGAGSTYVAPFLALAFARYHQQYPAVTVNLSPVGSSAGIAAISARQVDFGASDVPMNASELAAAQGGPVIQVPDALGAEGVAFNLDLPAGTRLRLTGPVLATIFLGQITSWRAPAITALNPGINLPHASIAVVHRSDGSGTTYIFSNYLSSVDPAWAAVKLLESITGPHLAPQSVDIEFSSHGLALPIDSDLFHGVCRRWTTSGLLLERAGQVKPATYSEAAQPVRRPRRQPYGPHQCRPERVRDMATAAPSSDRDRRDARFQTRCMAHAAPVPRPANQVAGRSVMMAARAWSLGEQTGR